MNQRQLPAKNRLPAQWIMLAAILLILGGVLCVNRYLERGRTGALERERLSTQARIIEKNLAWNLASVNQVLAALQKDRSRGGSGRGIEQRLNTLTDAMPGVRTMAIMDAKGTISASNWPELAGRNFKEREYFRTARLHPDADTLYVSSPFKTSLGVVALTLSRVVVGPGGEFAGMVGATLDPDYFTALLSSALYQEDMQTVIAHGNGDLFLLIPERPELLGRNLAQPGTFFTLHRDSGRETTFHAGKAYITGERRLRVWHTVRPDGLKMDKPLMVGVSRDLDAVYRVWRSENMVQVGLFALVALASSLGLYAYRLRQRQIDRQAAESAAALKESADRLLIATRAAGVGVWDYEPLTGRMLWDDSMFALYGTDKAAFSADYQAWRGAVLPEDLPALEAALQAAIGRRQPFHAEFRILRGDGEVRHIKAIAKVSFGADGSLRRIVGVNEDVTERRLAAEVLQRAMQSADAANKAKTEFLANMSHEIRTPMNAILGLIYLLQKTGLNPRQWDYAGKIRGAATSLLDILNDILDFSKVEAGRIELEQAPFSLDELLRNMSVILSADSQDKDVEVLFDVAADVPDNLVGDPLRLQQVLINLAGNAVKFTNCGEVALSVSLAGSAADRVELTVSIRDTGIGISADNLDRIFEGFTQAEVSTSRRFGGTGLGLAISSRLVRLMGGEIEVASEQGKGSVFSFTVGFGLQHAAPDRLSDPVPPRAGSLHLLIADDNAAAREALARMAASLGWSADLAADGGSALRLLAQAPAGGKKHDAALIDWRMPGVEGVEAGRRIRQLCKAQGIPLLVLATSYGREAMAEARQGDSSSADSCLLKPATRSMLLEAVADAARGYALLPSCTGEKPSRRFQGLRILLVEDNKVNQMVAREILEGEGALVVVADNGREAVGQVRSKELCFDAVLMDLQMPVMDGYQAALEIRNSLGEEALPIIAMTANAFEADRQRCLQAGFDAHLSKPIDVEMLAQTLGRHCAPNQTLSREPADAEEAELVLDAEEIAGLPGLDLGETLKRLNGNRLLYGRIARMVCSKYGDVPRQLERLWSCGDAAAAGQLLHTFRGVILNMGAAALGEFIGVLEEALTREGGPEGQRQLMARFEALAEEAIGSLRTVADRYGESAAQARQAGASSMASTMDHLRQLMVLLEESNMEAVDCFASFETRFGATLPAERMAWIGEAIAELDFPAALEYCSVLKAIAEDGSA